MGKDLSPFCGQYTRALEIIGRRWTGAILRALIAGRTRFNDIAHTVPGLSDRLLSQRLKELEAEGIITRTVTPCTPVLIEYALTESGKALLPVVLSVAQWAERWMPLEAESA
ncbi:MAG TPA: helix-turn-helix domain-containing protein [Actinomycetota bacterium]|jgi:DNA-binding HxlR family transcriptional regulator|nr:helix-turn-helix domain-containing protein [Actinomycetota bacterium]